MKDWTARQKQMRDLLDSISRRRKDEGINDDELAALDDMAMATFTVLETLNDAGVIDPKNPDQDGTLPLALANLSVMFCRTAGLDPITALRMLMSVFGLHTGINVSILRVDAATGEPLEDAATAGVSARALRTAMNTIMRERAAQPATATPAAPAPLSESTQQMVDTLMQSVWDADAMKVH